MLIYLKKKQISRKYIIFRKIPSLGSFLIICFIWKYWSITKIIIEKYCKPVNITFSLLATFLAQTDSFHFWSIWASSQTLRTTRVGAVNGKRIRNFVKCNWFNLIWLLGTLLVGPSTNTCNIYQVSETTSDVKFIQQFSYISVIIWLHYISVGNSYQNWIIINVLSYKNNKLYPLLEWFYLP